MFRDKIIYLFFFLFLFSCSLFSQDKKDKLSISLSGGLNISDKFDDKPWGAQFKYRGGISLDYAIHEYMFIRTGAAYSQKGSTYKKDIYKCEYDLEYLTIPLGLGLFVPVSDNLNLSAVISFYVDMGMNIKAKGYQDGVLYAESKSWYESNLKKNDFGVAVNGELGYKNIFVGVGLERGYGRLSEKIPGSVFSKWYNTCMNVTLGYRFRIL